MFRSFSLAYLFLEKEEQFDSGDSAIAILVCILHELLDILWRRLASIHRHEGINEHVLCLSDIQRIIFVSVKPLENAVDRLLNFFIIHGGVLVHSTLSIKITNFIII